MWTRTLPLILAAYSRTVSLIAMLLAFSCIISGCQGSSPADYASAGPLTGINFPTPAQLNAELDARGVSAAGQSKLGSEYESTLINNNIAVNTTKLDFIPSWDAGNSPQFNDLACALYLFDGTGLSGASTITSVWEVAPANDTCYIGLADFSGNHWVWFASTAGVPLPITDLAPFIDTGSNRILVAYVLIGTATCTLTSVTLGDAVPEIPLPVVPFTEVPMGGTGLAGPVIADGSPAFGIIEDQGGPTRLIYLRASDSDGAAWDSPVEIAAGSNGTPGMAIIGGNPAFVFQSGAGQLMYCRASDAQGAAWDSPVEVDGATPGAGLFAELLDVAGRPAIVYLASGSDQNSQPAMYIRADDATGSAWNATPIVLNPEYTSGEQARYMSFSLIGGNPAVVYNWVNATVGGLRYVRASDPTGATWSAPAGIPDTGYANDMMTMLRNIDLADLGGLPGVAYFVEDFGVPTNSVVKFVDAQDAAGAAWDAPQVVCQAAVGEDPVNFGSMQVLEMQDLTQRAIIVATRDGSVLNDQADVFNATVAPAGGADFSTGVKHMIVRFQPTKGSSLYKHTSCFDSIDYCGFILQLKFAGELYAQIFGAMVGYDMAANAMGVATTYGNLPASSL